jgi:voltage-gated potassium channel
MSALGVLFVLVILGEQLAEPGSGLSTVLTVLGWVLWAVFAAEFVMRAVVAPDRGGFFRRNWWQVLFIVLPFLRVLRLVRAARLLRTGRVLSGAVRGSRSATSGRAAPEDSQTSSATDSETGRAMESLTRRTHSPRRMS